MMGAIRMSSWQSIWGPGFFCPGPFGFIVDSVLGSVLVFVLGVHVGGLTAIRIGGPVGTLI